MKKINLVFVLAIAFALLVCASGVTSALSTKYIGNTIVDLEWSKYWSTDFSKYEICRDGSPITTIKDRSVIFYRDSGLTKGVTYGYTIYVYNSTGWLVDSGTTSAKTGDVHGTITRDTTWTAASSPYIQTGPVTVQKGMHFTIQPGVKVENSALYIYETLNVKSVSFNGFVHIYNSNASSIQDCSFDCSGITSTDCLYFSGGDNNILSNNIVSSNGHDGICLKDSSNNTLTNNTASNNGYGIYLQDSSNSILSNNIALKNNACGIYAYSCDNNIITNNIANANNCDGISLRFSCGNNISNNDIHLNEGGGIYVENSTSSTISNNNISGNSYYGIGLYSSNNNLIYNNYFNNTNNAAYDDGNNRWNITKTAGTNIIGGPYLGGNYWSDYTGIDTDEDGLGDWLTPYSCSGEIKNGGDYLPLSFLSLKPGDLLLCRSPGSVVPGFWTHVGMYVGDGSVVEALPKPGVTKTSVADWNYHYPDKTCVEALRVKTTDEIRNKSVSFVINQFNLDRPYDWCWWQKDADGEAWYCSELVWAAYLKASDGTINIEHGPDITGITPTEIDLDDDTEMIGEHKEIIPKRGFWIITKSPVDLSVTDPDDLSIDKESTGISGAIYGEDDLDDDGDPDDWIGIPEQKIGNYLITIIPELDAAPTDTYTLEVFTEDTTTVLAENVSVSEIPTEPYIFESKALTFDTGSSANPYPSIFGTHNGTIKPNHTVIATKLYTYSCIGTGGHTEYAEIRNATWNATATWEGYVGEWHNISFDKTVVLLTNETYNYTIRTGSYPQIIHERNYTTLDGSFINCTKFTDANGRV